MLVLKVSTLSTFVGLMISPATVAEFIQRSREYLEDTGDGVSGLVIECSHSTSIVMVMELSVIPFTNGYIDVFYKRGRKFYKFSESD